MYNIFKYNYISESASSSFALRAKDLLLKRFKSFRSIHPLCLVSELTQQHWILVNVSP